MASNIDPTKPVESDNSVIPPVHPTTESVRGNFQAAKDEIEALQASQPVTALLGSTDGNTLRRFKLSFIKGAGGGITCAIQTNFGRGFNVAAHVDVTVSAEVGKSGNASVGSGAQAVTYSMDSTGAIMTVDLVETITNILGVSMDVCSAGTALLANVHIASGSLVVNFANASSGAPFDLLSMTTGQTVEVSSMYVVGGAA